MRVEGELKYLAPHEVPTRDQELQNIKTEELIKRDASGHLRAHDETKVPDADTRTDLRLRQAYTRRGLALEVADVMTFTVHEKLVDKLFQEYQREPPAGYNQVTLGQLTAADRRAWKMMSEEIQGDLGRNGLGRRLADVALEKVIAEPASITADRAGADRSWQEEVDEGESEAQGTPEGGGDEEEETGTVALRRGQDSCPKEDADQNAEGAVGPHANETRREDLLRVQYDHMQGKRRQVQQGSAYLHAMLEERACGNQLPEPVRHGWGR